MLVESYSEVSSSSSTEELLDMLGFEEDIDPDSESDDDVELEAYPCPL